MIYQEYEDDYAGFWRRLSAFAIDAIILAIAGFILKQLGILNDSLISELILTVIMAIYSITFIAGKWQATPGMRIMSVYIVDGPSGQKIQLVQSGIRYLVFNALVIVNAVMYVHMNVQDIPYTDAENAHYAELKHKPKETLTSEERSVINYRAVKVIAPIIKLSIEDQRRYVNVAEEISQKRSVSSEDQQFYSDIQAKMTSIEDDILDGLYAMIAYFLLNSLMIGLTKEKTGLHDMIAKTRALHRKP